MRVVFLDIDGVIATQGTYTRFDNAIKRAGLPYTRVEALDNIEKLPPAVAGTLIEPTCVSNVRELVLRAQAKIVVSSSWRNTTSWAWLCSFLEQHHLELHDKTCTLESTRGAEIDEWVQTHGLEPRDFVILEDEEDVRPWNGRRVQTSFFGSSAGFRPNHMRRALRLFEGHEKYAIKVS